MHWRNSNFQIKQFIAGSCHTADEAYHKLCELKEERDMAIRAAAAALLREKAKIAKATSIINSNDSKEWEKLEAQADLEEINAFKEQSQLCYDEAVRESNYIQTLIDQVQPLRKFSHLPDHEAHQMAQQEEWKLELIFRTENFLTSQGFIPHDHLATMRMHPEFHSHILPRIQEVSAVIANHREALVVLSNPNTPQEQKMLAQQYIDQAPDPLPNKAAIL